MSFADPVVDCQINQDGAGPLTAAVDGTSGWTQASAFQTDDITQDVAGLGFRGLSLAANRDLPLTVQMPAGTACEGTVTGIDNVCVVRVRNGAGAGPFGRSAAFTQSLTARKWALAESAVSSIALAVHGQVHVAIKDFIPLAAWTASR